MKNASKCLRVRESLIAMFHSKDVGFPFIPIMTSQFNETAWHKDNWKWDIKSIRWLIWGYPSQMSPSLTLGSKMGLFCYFLFSRSEKHLIWGKSSNLDDRHLTVLNIGDNFYNCLIIKRNNFDDNYLKIGQNFFPTSHFVRNLQPNNKQKNSGMKKSQFLSQCLWKNEGALSRFKSLDKTLWPKVK